MDIPMLINRVSTSAASATVDIGGEPTDVTIPQIEVELVDPKGQQGSVVFRFRTTTERDFAAKFVQGETFTLTI